MDDGLFHWLSGADFLGHQFKALFAKMPGEYSPLHFVDCFFNLANVAKHNSLHFLA